MIKKSALFLPVFFLLSIIAVPLLGQKSKSSDKLYERGGKKKEVTVKNVNFINTDRMEFSPQFYQNGIVYVSTRKSGPLDKDNEPYLELFYAETDRNGMPMNPEPFSVELNSQQHEGPVSFSRDMKYIFFTRNNKNKNGVPVKDPEAGKVGLKIYEAKRGYFDWENVNELPTGSEPYSSAFPALSPDGTRLYFSSNMPGGYGDTDLYVIEKVGEKWGEPKNLGPEINTPGKEGFPFFHETGTLFFSSTGHKSSGGYDVFGINLDGENEVFSLGEPFNSPGDDIGFIINKDGTHGFFSSNREGGFGKDDIYTFEAPNGIPGVEEVAKLIATLTVTDGITGLGVDGAYIRILEQSTDGLLEGDNLYDVEMVPNPESPDELLLKLVRRDVEELDVPAISTKKNGEANAELKSGENYIILVSKEGYENQEVLYAAKETEKGTDVIPITLNKQACILLNGLVLLEPDNVGLAGATVTIVNNCDSTAQILKTDNDGEFEYCMPPGCEFSVTAEKSGFSTGVNQLTTLDRKVGSSLNTTITISAFGEDGEAGPAAEGDVIVLENIYYDFGKSSIRSGAARDLDALITLMKKYPSMEIELIAHTDSRGDAQFNQELSLKRAESARSYLVKNDIKASRIKAFGYGESQPRNHCLDGVECTEEEHAFNRRTEVKITRIDRPVKVEYKIKKP